MPRAKAEADEQGMAGATAVAQDPTVAVVNFRDTPAGMISAAENKVARARLALSAAEDELARLRAQYEENDK
jgi:hypothetical protein